MVYRQFCFAQPVKYKEVTNSGRFRWPRNKNEVLELSEQQLRWLLDGLSIAQKTSIKQVPKRG